ncbi:LexA family transcriptional regulator [Larkinella soli]|uniref:LexA family transcriptional regulator n=1 Tax=Larkinella soli TaxID=1770527 RepID=UPI0013E3FB53|nr:LexA family transcriptional regulator [Larkinella soli]
MTVFAQKIKEYRKKHGLTQFQLAERLGIKGQSVQQWESGRTYPRGSRLSALADLLELKMSDLFPNQTNSRLLSLEVHTVPGLAVPSDGLFCLLPLVMPANRAIFIRQFVPEQSPDFIKDGFLLALPEGADPARYLVVEVEGDRMKPELKDRARVLAEAVPPAEIPYESGGIYAVLFAGRFVVGRIKTNDLGQTDTLTVHSDDERFGSVTIKAADLRGLWKVTRIVDAAVY